MTLEAVLLERASSGCRRSVYDVLETHLASDAVYRSVPDEPAIPVGELVHQWRAKWEQRVADCEAGKDEWPSFRTKAEGAEFR